MVAGNGIASAGGFGSGVQPSQDFVSFLRDGSLQPLLENRRDRQGQPQDFHAGPARPGGCGDSQDGGDLVIGQGRDDGGDQDAHGHAGVDQEFDGLGRGLGG